MSDHPARTVQNENVQNDRDLFYCLSFLQMIEYESTKSTGGGSGTEMNQNSLSTEELLALLFKTPNLSCFLDGRSSDITLPSFPEYISSLCAARQEVPEHIIQKSGLEKSFGHQLFNGRRTPSRDTVLQLAFGFSLSVPEAQELLRVARKSPLYPRVKRDAAILYCLYHGFSFVDSQIILHDLDLPLLGGGRKND